MFLSIFKTELFKSIRSPAFLIFAGILFFFSFQDASNDIPTRNILTRFGQAWHNAPLFISQTFALLSVIGVLFTVVLVARSVAKDFDAKIHHFFFTTPINKFSYLFGRFLGGLTSNVLIYVGVIFGLLVGWAMIDPKFTGPISLGPILFGFAFVLVPNLILMGSIFFSLATLTRKMFLTYMAAIGFLLLYTMISGAIPDSADPNLRSILDPTLISYFSLETTNWTVAEINNNPAPVNELFIFNRVLWLLVSIVILTFAYYRFRFVAELQSRSKRQQEGSLESEGITIQTPIPRANLRFGWRFDLVNSLKLSWKDSKRILFHPAFLILTFMAVRQAYHNFTVNAGPNGSDVYPFTSFYLRQVDSIFGYMIPITIVFGGILVWRERDLRTNELYDSFPNAPWMNYASKMFSLLSIQFFYVISALVGGVLAQTLIFGYFNLEFDLYFKRLVAVDFINYVHMAIVVIFIHNLVSNKYMGYFLCALYYVADLVIFNAMGLGSGLTHYGFLPVYQYSNITGFGHFVPLLFWHRIYWLFFGLLLACLSFLLWRRSSETRLKLRVGAALHYLTPKTRILLVVLLSGFISTGSFIYYNTYTLNDYSDAGIFNDRREKYEREYKHLELEGTPEVVAIDLDLDFYPEDRSASVDGSYTLVNKNRSAIREIYYNLTNRRITSPIDVKLSRPSRRVASEPELGFYGLELETPLKPGDSVSLNFSYNVQAKGFSENNPKNELAFNGSYLHNSVFQMPNLFPAIGYNSNYEISDNTERRRRGLEEKSIFSPLDDSLARRRTIGDMVKYNATLSTSENQHAITNGNLVSSWSEGNRKYFSYSTDTVMNSALVMISGEFEVLRDKYQDVDLEIFYHPDHAFNIERMMAGMKASLQYCSRNFSPYPYKNVRIVEATVVGYPGNGTATSQPTIFTWQENGGFISNLEGEESLDVVFNTTTHEMAHQWFGHILRPAQTQGVAVLVETLAQYVRLMCLREAYGRETTYEFLNSEMDNYLFNRKRDLIGEKPMLETENQAYLNYRKGSVVMYALQEYISEDSVNSALRSLIREFGLKPAPYPTTPDLVKAFRKVTPDTLQYLISDLFEDIILYENKMEAGTYVKDENGKFIVSLTFNSTKLRSDGIGNEVEVPINDYLPIEVEGVNGEVLYSGMHQITSERTELEILVNDLPAKAGIDPNLIHIDRTRSNNQVKLTLQSMD